MPDVSAGQHNITVWYTSDGFLSVTGDVSPGSIGWVLLGG
jgi:hypothetical protein